jgi:ankyrin repeat protein
MLVGILSLTLTDVATLRKVYLAGGLTADVGRLLTDPQYYPRYYHHQFELFHRRRVEFSPDIDWPLAWQLSRQGFLPYHGEVYLRLALEVGVVTWTLELVGTLGLPAERILQVVDLDKVGDLDAALRRACTNGHIEVIKVLLADGRADPTNTIAGNYFVEACRDGRLEVVKVLLTDRRVDPAITTNWALQLACSYGHTEVVKVLLSDPRVNPAVVNGYAFQFACRYGRIEVVKVLLKDGRVDPATSNNAALGEACRHGCIDVVKLLLCDKRIDPSAHNSSALEDARSNDHTEVVKLLMIDGRVNPADNSEILMWAYRSGHTEIVKLLLKDGRVDPAHRSEVLEQAYQDGNIEAVKLLASADAVTLSDPEIQYCCYAMLYPPTPPSRQSRQ